jgi:hypothetical protein
MERQSSYRVSLFCSRTLKRQERSWAHVFRTVEFRKRASSGLGGNSGMIIILPNLPKTVPAGTGSFNSMISKTYRERILSVKDKGAPDRGALDTFAIYHILEDDNWRLRRLRGPISPQMLVCEYRSKESSASTVHQATSNCVYAWVTPIPISSSQITFGSFVGLEETRRKREMGCVILWSTHASGRGDLSFVLR